MLDQIIDAARRCGYDFRENACPEDPLLYLFEDWVPRYRMKWAIARVLRPPTILEAGVRFGYAATAFLDASPSARYLGIDSGVEAWGDSRRAIAWARQATRQYNADFFLADSRLMDRFPGGRYGLIHVAGEQDEERLAHVLTLSLAQADYVLVDNSSSSRQAALFLSDLLFRYRDAIELYAVIGGGDVLIKTAARRDPLSPASSMDLRSSYTRGYYLSDCGGYDAFKRTTGARLEDVRLQAVAKLARVAQAGRALDLGCGRGEISVALARDGFEVTAVDYSPDAIELAREAARAVEKDRLLLHCCDVNAAPLAGRYNLAVASDLIEHLTPGELDRLYGKVKRHLAGDALFLIHTYPNLWFYQYEHPRRWKAAQALGAYLPKQPRSRYELLMHINEQSPRVLLKQLGKHFEHVLMWFGSPYEPVANLARKFSRAEMRASSDLFAAASLQPISRERFLEAFRMGALPAFENGEVEIRQAGDLLHCRPGGRLPLSVIVKNDSPWELRSLPPNPVHLAYHWLAARDRSMVVFEGERTPLCPELRSHSSETYPMLVRAPAAPGDYVLRITLVQEGVRWFDDPPVGCFLDVPVRIAL